MQLTELRLRVRSRIGNPNQTDVPDSPNLDQHINGAYQEIFNKYKFKRRRALGKFTTVVGVDKYDVSGQTDVIYKAWDRTNGTLLEKIGKTKIAQRDFDASPNALVQNGKPDKWAHVETYFQVFPPPDGLYSIEFLYKVRPAILSNAPDTPIIPSVWHRGIVILGAAIYYEDEGADPAKAVFNRNAFRDWVSDMPVEEHEETEAVDSGVELPSLGSGRGSRGSPDGAWWDRLP